MLNGICFDLNSIQLCFDSFNERVQTMMLKQELAYMGQVFDLHRLYRIQTAMADDIKQKKSLDDYNSHARGMNSSAVNLNNQLTYSMNDIQRYPPGFKPEPLDLQLSADEFIRQSGNSSLRDSPIESKREETSAFDLNLSLNADEETSKTGAEDRPWIGKKTCPDPPVIIDLEDSDDNLDPVFPPGFSIPNSSFRGDHKFQRSLTSDKHDLQSVSKNGSGRATVGTTSNAEQSHQRQTLGESGFNGEVKPSDTLVSRKSFLFDLNTIQLDDDTSESSYIHSTETAPTVIPSGSPTSRAVADDHNRPKILDIHVQHNLNGKSSTDSNPDNNNKGKVVFIDLVSDSDSDSDTHKEFGSAKSDPTVESVGSSSKLDGFSGESTEIGKGEAAEEKDREPFCQNLSVAEQPIEQKLPKISLPESVTNAQTLPPPVKGGNSNLPTSEEDERQRIDVGVSAKNKGKEVVETAQNAAGELVAKVSRVISGNSNMPSTEDETQRIDVGLSIKNKGKQVVETVQVAAGEPSVELSHQNLNSEVCRRKIRDRRQSSIDSYEELVLNAKECGPDEYCVSSNAFAVEVPEETECRYKLKRGTRLKNFQKDILSSLSTLSRQEIREDVNTFEGVIKSREYKKNRSKYADDEDWCIKQPTRSKRSRTSRK